jgi:hypothetical protein
MTAGTRSKLSFVGSTAGVILAANVLWFLLAPAIPALHASPRARPTSQAVFARQTASQSAP